MEYLDLVELINEKPSYLEAGVKLGDFGAVVSEKSINGQWQVIFSEFYTGKDIADILVSEEDLKISYVFKYKISITLLLNSNMFWKE